MNGFKSYRGLSKNFSLHTCNASWVFVSPALRCTVGSSTMVSFIETKVGVRTVASVAKFTTAYRVSGLAFSVRYTRALRPLLKSSLRMELDESMT